MAIMILDPSIASEIRARFDAHAPDRQNEVWEGMLVMPPAPNTEHFRIASRLNSAFSAVIDWDRGDQTATGGNVSDRDAGWEHNYRIPDVLVALAGSPAVDHGAHWEGGPDLLVEIVSPGEDRTAKFGFYAGVGVREVLVVDRDPWALELFRLQSGRLVSVGRVSVADGVEVSSGVLPVVFYLDAGADRPWIRVRHTGTGQTWTA